MSQETMTMERVYEKLEAVSDNVDSMATSVKQIENKQITMDMHVSSIMTPPTLETRLKSYVDDAVSRNHASFMQALGNAQTIIQQGQRIAQLEMQSQILVHHEHRVAKDHSRNLRSLFLEPALASFLLSRKRVNNHKKFHKLLIALDLC